MTTKITIGLVVILTITFASVIYTAYNMVILDSVRAVKSLELSLFLFVLSMFAIYTAIYKDKDEER